MSDQPTTIWITLELDPGTAHFYGLPIRINLPDDPGAPFLGGYGFEASLGDLARALEKSVILDPELEGHPEILRFLNRWPRYADLDRYLRMGNDTFARKVAAGLMRDDPNDPPPLATLAVLEAKEGRWERAGELLERSLDRAPSHATTRLQFALCLAGAGRSADALERLEELVELPRIQSLARLWRYEIRRGPPADQASRLRAHLQNLMGIQGPEGQDALWESLYGEFPDNPEVLFARTVRPGGVDDDDQREDLLERAIAADPDHVPALTTLAAIYRRSGRAEQALALLDRAGADASLRLLAVRGQTLEVLGNRKRALEAYREVFQGPLALLPGSALLMAGEGLLRLAPASESRRLLEDAAGARPGDALPHQLLARLDETAGAGSEAAERRIRRAIKECGPIPLLQYALGDLLRRSGRRVEAEGLFKVLARRHPGAPWGPRGLGDLLVQTEPARAIEHYVDALKLDPTLPIPGFDYLAGVSALRSGDLTTARRHLQRAVAAEPDNARYWCDLGAVLFYQGETGRALAATGRALDLEPGHPGFLHNLAEYHAEQFRRQPLRHPGSWFRAMRLRRRVAQAREKGWRRDLWKPENGDPREGPPPAGPGSSPSRTPPPDR